MDTAPAVGKPPVQHLAAIEIHDGDDSVEIAGPIIESLGGRVGRNSHQG